MPNGTERNAPVLAQYSVRSKQGYIYKTNKILQITGASENIKNAFSLLVESATNAGIKIANLTEQGHVPFSLSETTTQFSSGALQGKVLFEGGGNLTILFASEQACLAANRAFTYACLRDMPGLTPLCIFCAIDVAKDDYKGDYANLMLATNTRKNEMSNYQPLHALPCSLPDRTTGSPITCIKNGVQLTAEGMAKLNSAKQTNLSSDNDLNARLLDKLVTQSGEESLLAVIFVDGNGMGIKVQNHLKDCNGYDVCVNAMRAFSAEIEETFVKKGYDAVKSELTAIKAENPFAQKDEHTEVEKDPRFACRAVIAGGDEITFICNARFAMRLTEAYLKALPPAYSSCAGICIFHHHFPFSSAYAIAESCCENAKAKPHAAAMQSPELAEQCWLDWHYLHSGVGGDVDAIRATQDTACCVARPWQILRKTDGWSELAADEGETLAQLYTLDHIMKKYRVTRTNIKTIGVAYERSVSEGDLELARVYSRNAGLENDLCLLFTTDRLRNALYDYAESYDLWFSRRTKTNQSQGG